MKWEFLYHQDLDFIEIIVSGPMSHEGLNAMALERRAEMQKLGCERFLFDFTRVSSALSIADLYQRPEESERLGVLKGRFSAAVVPERFLQEFKFLETVYKNRGFNLNVFTKRETALQYLDRDPS